MRENIAEKMKMKSDDKRLKKTRKCLTENYQGGIWLNCSTNGTIKDMIGNIGDVQRKIRDSGRKTRSLGTIRIHS